MNSQNFGRRLEQCEVVNVRHLSSSFFELSLAWKGTVPKTGQFFVLTHTELSHPVPLTFYRSSDGTLTFLVKRAGKNTEFLSRLPNGFKLNVLGPCGNGFDGNSPILGVGGGSGVAALFSLPPDSKVLLGFKTREVELERSFREKFNELKVAVEEKGKTVVDLLLEELDLTKFTSTLLCGPLGMIKAVKNSSVSLPNPHVILEAIMGCGMGVCLGCTVKTRSGLKKVCIHGPVFPLEEVVL